ncbi:MAG: S9 family peptidase [Sphingomonadales bacterium]|nr:S9 family peptidase [Sphingomonadales bacterium]
MTIDTPRPPVAARRPHSISHHGVTIEDPYFWLRDPSYPKVDDPAILAHLNAENAYFEAQMKPYAPLVEVLFREMKGRLKEDESSVPQKDGNFLYWRRFEKGAQYKQWMRKPVVGGDDEVILDEAKEAQGTEFFRLGEIAITEDDRIMAWSSDTDGSERFTIQFRDLATGKNLADAIPGTLGGIVFSKDGQSLFYGLVNENWRIDRIMRHTLGTPAESDQTIYIERDRGFQAGVGMTHDRNWIVIAAGDNETSEVHLIPSNNAETKPLLVRARRKGVEYDVEAHGDTLFIHTNDTSPQFRLVTAPIANPGDWTERIAPSTSFYMTDVTTFADFFVVEGRDNGLDQVELHKYEGGTPRRIEFPEASYSAGLDENPEYQVSSLRLSYESMVTPDTIAEYSLATDTMKTLKVQEIPSGYDADQYVTERLEITARDGITVPVSVVYRKDFRKDGNGPLYVYGYGAYGIAIPPGFSTLRLSLLDRGFAYAIAHIRGGDDLGQQWQLEGKLTKRTNTFNDFVDCTKGLIALGFARPGRVVAAGGSAGGELMGVIANTDPDLWGALAAHVPFVDVLNTMLDDSLPLTPGEFPEWGNPIEDKDAFDLIRSYSPYDQVKAQDYPPILATAGLNDPRVTYWEPAKWVAKLRAAKTDDNMLLLKTNMGAGHGGKSGRFESLREDAEEYAFFLWQLGMAAQ